MTPRALPFVVGCLLAVAPLSAQRLHSNPISADSARVLLGADPLVVPGLAVRGIYVLWGRSVMIEQSGDSGRAVTLREARHGSAVLMGPPRAAPGEGPPSAAQAALQGQPLPAEQQASQHRRHRYIAPLNVTVLQSRGADPEVWLGRLSPLSR
jgi:hypothetical protein